VTSLHERYLKLLGFDKPPSGLDGLRLLVRRHLCRVPFENVSKLLLFGREGKGRRISLVEFLDGIENHDLGGTCYSSNPWFADLLRGLGYQADLLGADMTNPNVHTCIRVRVAGKAYHVDVGFAAPFREPIPLDGVPFEIAEGAHRYIFDGSEMAFYSEGKRGEGYVAHDPPRTMEFFEPIIRDSFRPDAYFLNTFRVARFFDDYSVSLLGTTLWVHRDGATRETELHSVGDIEAAVHGLMKLPRCPVAEAIGVLRRHLGQSEWPESVAQDGPVAES